MTSRAPAFTSGYQQISRLSQNGAKSPVNPEEFRSSADQRAVGLLDVAGAISPAMDRQPVLCWCARCGAAHHEQIRCEKRKNPYKWLDFSHVKRWN